MQHACDDVWSKEGGETSRTVRMHEVLKCQECVALIEHPPILERHRAIFGRQVHLRAIALLRQGVLAAPVIRTTSRRHAILRS